LPTPEDNDTAGSAPGGYDYGMFNIANLIAKALHDKEIGQVSVAQRKAIYKESRVRYQRPHASLDAPATPAIARALRPSFTETPMADGHFHSPWNPRIRGSPLAAGKGRCRISLMQSHRLILTRIGDAPEWTWTGVSPPGNDQGDVLGGDIGRILINMQ